jgi:CHAT domain-containing protein
MVSLELADRSRNPARAEVLVAGALLGLHRVKGRSMLDYLSAKPELLPVPQGPAWEQLMQHSRKLDQLDRELKEHHSAITPRSGPNQTDLAGLEIHLLQAKQAYKRCAAKAAGTLVRPSVVPPAVPELMANLRALCPVPNRPVLVDFLQSENELVVFLKPLWQDGGIVVERLKRSAQSAWSLVMRMFGATEILAQRTRSRPGLISTTGQETTLEQRRAAHDTIAEVVDELREYLDPWMSRIEREGWKPTELVLSPHTVLGLLPLHAASWRSQPLFEHLPIAYLPTPAIASQLIRRLKPWDATTQVLLLGNPDGRSNAMAQEIQFLEKLWRKWEFPVEVLEKTRANHAQFLAVAPKASVLHCALHSSVDQDILERSGLDLADGRLSTLDIIHRVQWERLQFVFLNSCDSGVGETKRTDNLLVLVRSFFCAGAASVGASLWPVDDEAGSCFAQYFYKTWLEEKCTLAQAFQQAMRQTRLTLDERPYYWAPFFLMGAWGTKCR